MTDEIKLDDLVGQKFGRWTVLSPSRVRTKDRQKLVICRCECGTKRRVKMASLRNHSSLSCGCLARERSVLKGTTHGMTNSITYRSWASMKSRCHWDKSENYHLYGGKGISVCPQWLRFEGFLADMGERPSKNHSLDRIDSDKNYEPGNCRWATKREQALNCSRVKLSFEGAVEIAVAKLMGESDRKLGARYGMAHSTAREILTGRRWPGAAEAAKEIVRKQNYQREKEERDV